MRVGIKLFRLRKKEGIKRLVIHFDQVSCLLFQIGLTLYVLYSCLYSHSHLITYVFQTQISRILTDPKEFLQREDREKKEALAAEKAEKEAIEKEANRARLKKEARLRQRIEAHAKKMSSEKSRVADQILKSESFMVPLDMADKVSVPPRLPN